METLPIPRTTLAQMVDAWVLAEQDIKKAYALMVDVEHRLKLVFKSDGYLFDLSRDTYEAGRYEDPERMLALLKKDVWSAMINRMEVRRIMSSKRVAELDNQLKTGEGLPEITFENMLAMLEGTLNNVNRYMEEAVLEVFEFLRPHRSEYKTNTEFEVGERVILSWSVESCYGPGFRVNYHKQQQLTSLDNVMHVLDGKGTVKTTRGPLVDAIEATRDTGAHIGKTEYFEFKCFLNRNLHLKFRRMDLVARLNQVAGGARLKA